MERLLPTWMPQISTATRWSTRFSGGADASFFDVDAATGVVSIPNELLIFGDADNNALYEVEVTVTDGNGGLDTIDLTFNLFASA